MCSAYLTIISPWKKVYSSPIQTFIPFTKRCSVSSMAEIWPGVLEEVVFKAVYEFSLLCYHMNEHIDRQQADRQADRHTDAKQLIRKAKLKTHLNLIKMPNLYRISHSFGIGSRGGINSSPYGYLSWKAEISLSQSVSRDILEQDSPKSKQLSCLAKYVYRGWCTYKYMIYMFILNITQYQNLQPRSQ